MKKKIGFIGIGLMGEPMALNILKNDFPLFIYNRTIAKSKKLKQKGATLLNSPQEVAAKVDVLITIVTNGEALDEILFGSNGVFTLPLTHKLTVIDMSTIGQIKAKEIAVKLEKQSVSFLDAPVTGGTSKAISGELTIFVGGKESILKENKNVLTAMGTNIVYLGENL